MYVYHCVCRQVELTFRIKIRDYLLYCMQTVLYGSVMMLQILFNMCRRIYATISCITCNSCALNI